MATNDKPNTPAKPPKPAPTYPRVVYIKQAGSPGYQAVTVKDADAEKALGVVVFDTALEAAEFSPPIEQPISHIARTENEEQFVPGKSQPGATISYGVAQTPVPVHNVYVKTGVDTDTLALHAVLPDGVDPGTAFKDTEGNVVFKGVSGTGVPMTPMPPAQVPPQPPAHKG